METKFIKAKKETNYTVLDNTFIQDTRLSWKAKGVMTYLLSLPDDWVIHLSEIERHATDGKDSLRSAINELKKYGYILTEQKKDASGRFCESVYTVYEKPKIPYAEKPLAENPYTEKPLAENPPLQNTNNTKYEIIQSTKSTKECALDCLQTKNLVNTFFEKITKHNQEQIEQKKKIPISQNMIAFAQKEGRLILDYVKNEDTETVLEALDNYLTVANSDTWKTVFSLTAFLKNYNEYTPAFFDPSKYDKETDTDKIVQSFRQKMESDSRFDIGLFLLHKQDWLDAGRPHGEKYWEMQENWDC